MYRQILALLLTAFLALTLSACSTEEKAPEGDSGPSASQPGGTISPPDAADPGDGKEEGDPQPPEPGDGVTPESPGQGGSDGGDAEKPADKPAAKPETPTAKPDPTPSPAPDNPPDSKPGDSADFTVGDIWASIQTALGDSLPALTEMDADTLTTLYPLSTDDLEEYGLYLSPMSVQASEIFIARVKDGKMDTVKAAVASRQADLLAQWEHYLPAQLELVQNYKLVENGDYLLFCVAEKAGDAVDTFNGYTK